MKKLLIAAAFSLLPIGVIAQDFKHSRAAAQFGDDETVISVELNMCSWGKPGDEYRLVDSCTTAPKERYAALGWYREAANQGDSSAQNSLGAILYRGGNYRRASRWYHLSAEQGNPLAQFNLGGMYESGKGVLQSYPEAAQWHLLAAKQGLTDALNSLGIIYASGMGLPIDNVTAHMWFNVASASDDRRRADGSKKARRNRDKVAALMTFDQINEAQHRAQVCMVSSYQDCG